MRYAAIFGVLIIVGLPSQVAGQSALAAGLLPEIFPPIEITNGQGGRILCHGFVDGVQGESAYAVTTKHCLDEPHGVPLGNRVNSALSATGTQASGDSGSVQRRFWDKNNDGAGLVADFNTPPHLRSLDWTAQPSTSSPPAMTLPLPQGGIANIWGGAFRGRDGESPYIAALTPYGWNVNVTGVIVLADSHTATAQCFSILHVSGALDYLGRYALSAKSDDGTIRMTLLIAVSGGTLAGTYDVLPTGTACDGDSGTIIAHSNA